MKKKPNYLQFKFSIPE